MSPYNAKECARLIAEAREDDERMTSVPWISDSDGLSIHGDIGHASGPVLICELGGEVMESDGQGIARTRNNLHDMADQLAAAAAEIDRRDRIDQGRKCLTDTISRLVEDNERQEAALRAIRPVYRAAVAWHACADARGLGSHREGDLDSSVRSARAAITPDLLAVLERLKLEGGRRPEDPHSGCSDERCRRCYGAP